MAGEISFSGLASGIDFDSIIEKMIEAESFQKKKMTDWKAEWEDKVDVLQELNNKLTSINTANNNIKTPSSFYSKLASSSDSDVAEVAADSTARNGSYDLEVASNSKEIIASTGWTDSNTTTIASGAGTFEFEDSDGNTISVAVDATMTLEDLKTAIDNEISNQGSTASTEIVDDGSDSNSYRLRIIDSIGGLGNEITINQDDTLLSFESNTIDEIEDVDWSSGTASDTVSVSAGSSYRGHVTKRLNFEIISETGTVGTDALEIRWTDEAQSNTGTFTIDADYTAGESIDVTQGISLEFTVGDTMTKNDKFALDLFNPTIQQSQDSGLAQAAKVVHQGFVDRDSTAVTTTDSTFSFSYGGSDVVNIGVSADSTLQDLADTINSSSNNPGIVASIINDGTGSANAYHLVLTGEDSGAANQIPVSDIDYSGFTNTQFTGSSFEQTNKATNSLIKTDDYPTGDSFIQNDSNLLTDVIDGVSINLKKSGTTEITVNDDVDAMTEKVQDFVDKYNEAMTYINDITEVVLNEEDEADSSQSGTMVGNYGVNAVAGEMKSFITSRAEGFEDGVDDHLLLSQLGITTGENNLLEFDQEVFKDALQEDSESVVDFFTADRSGVSSNTKVVYSSFTNATEPGKYNFTITTDASGDAQDSTYYVEGDPDTTYTLQASADGKYLTATDGPASGMAVELVNISGSETLEGTLRIKRGKSQEYYNKMDEILDEESGIIKVLQDNYERIINNQEDKIESETERIAMVRKRLEQKYANLEVTLQEQNSMMERLQQQIQSLPSGV